MIEIEQHYKLTLSEEQTRQLYQLLLDAKDTGNLHIDGRTPELRPIYNKLKHLFDN
jgi:hypothetical protein